MTKRAVRPPAVAPPPPIQVEIAKPIAWSPRATLKVQVVEPEKKPDEWDRWRPRVMWALAVVLAAAFLMALIWLVPTTYTGPLTNSTVPELAILLTYPSYVTRGDEGTIDLTVINTSAQIISGTVSLVFGDSPPVQISDGSANTMTLKDLPSGGRQSLRVRYRIAEAPALGSGALIFTPRVTIQGHSPTNFDQQQVDIAFVPLLRTVISGAFGVSALVGLFWDQIKKRLFG